MNSIAGILAAIAAADAEYLAQCTRIGQIERYFKKWCESVRWMRPIRRVDIIKLRHIIDKCASMMILYEAKQTAKEAAKTAKSIVREMRTGLPFVLVSQHFDQNDIVENPEASLQINAVVEEVDDSPVGDLRGLKILVKMTVLYAVLKGSRQSQAGREEESNEILEAAEDFYRMWREAGRAAEIEQALDIMGADDRQWDFSNFAEWDPFP